jgi:energy-converting hydrogenase Eha subunit C
MLLKLATRLEILKQDRGEGPIPHIIMIALISAGAVILAAGILSVATGWVAKIPR